ncbi:MAG TPA: PH domain-containing protein [Bryobacteraceae bacterium]|jgi:membrane protein YdbS with pleckstrin-like domain|nr:PH domain-containing protein [Bryobacteraceae bacterium]
MQLRPSLKFVKLSYVLCLLLAIGLAVLLVAERENPDVQEWGKWTFIAPAILAFFTLLRHIQKRMIKVTITNDRVREEIGLFSKSTRTLELIKIQEVTVQRTIWQRIFGLGDLSMQTAGSSSNIEVHSIDRPQQAADHILEMSRAQRNRPDAGTQEGHP